MRRQADDTLRTARQVRAEMAELEALTQRVKANLLDIEATLQRLTGEKDVTAIKAKLQQMANSIGG